MTTWDASPRRAGWLASKLRTSPPAMSRHLRVLRTTGLVSEEHGGKKVVRKPAYAAMRETAVDLEGCRAKKASATACG